MRRTHGVGDAFAGYEIQEPLGKGGMSEVFRAKNPRLGNLVALKLLAPELADDALFRERFVRESQIAASLDHPNVIPILDAGEADGVPYIVMRYVDGPNLGELLQRGDLPLAHAVSIVCQVAGALDAAHDRGLIHRDVKPGNILIDRYMGLDSAPHVYLSDFGVAKHTLSRSGLTSTGQFVGTIDYVAPEQIEGKQVDRKTDVYSLGCVLYECLTGAKPFERESNVAVMYAHLLEAPPAPSTSRAGLSPEVDAVVAKALAKAPDDRYATCGELAAAARASVAGRPEAESIVTAPLLDIDSGTGMVARPLPPPPAPEPEPERPSRLKTSTLLHWRRPPKPLIAGAVVLALLGAGFAAAQNLGGDAAAPNPSSRASNEAPISDGGAVSNAPPKQVAVPRLIGATRRQAVAKLRQLGLRASVRRAHDLRKQGRIASQAPRGGRLVLRASTVRLTVSKGPLPTRTTMTTTTRTTTTTPTTTTSGGGATTTTCVSRRGRPCGDTTPTTTICRRGRCGSPPPPPPPPPPTSTCRRDRC